MADQTFTSAAFRDAAVRARNGEMTPAEIAAWTKAANEHVAESEQRIKEITAQIKAAKKAAMRTPAPGIRHAVDLAWYAISRPTYVFLGVLGGSVGATSGPLDGVTVGARALVAMLVLHTIAALLSDRYRYSIEERAAAPHTWHNRPKVETEQANSSPR